MDFLTTLLISIGLAMDCFAVSLCAATINVKQNFRYRFRISFHFGLFQGGFTLIGYLLGSTIASLIQSFDHWIAFGLLIFVAIKMIKEGLETDEDFCPSDPSRGKNVNSILCCNQYRCASRWAQPGINQQQNIFNQSVNWYNFNCTLTVGFIFGSKTQCIVWKENGDSRWRGANFHRHSNSNRTPRIFHNHVFNISPFLEASDHYKHSLLILTPSL